MTQQQQLNTDIKIRINAPARLHLGFLDLNGSTGRKFGSIGLAINSHRIILQAQRAKQNWVLAAGVPKAIVERAYTIIAQFYDTLGSHLTPSQQGIELSLQQYIPSHAGLGSGTQLAIAIGTALSQLHNIPLTTQQIAQQLSRGNRSGIGIAAFDQGGFIIDAGVSAQATMPTPVIYQQLAKSWRIVLIMVNNSEGVHGEQEMLAFEQLPLFPLTDSQAICHRVLMQLLPAIIEQNINDFGQAITEIQTLLGDHFASAQGGGRYANEQVAALLHYAQQLGHTGIAQSSWGPTGCIFVESEQVAQQLISQLSRYVNQYYSQDNQLSILSAQPNNEGANIELISG